MKTLYKRMEVDLSMVMPSYTGVSNIHPTIIRPYTFDILNAVLFALHDPEQYGIFMKNFYDKVSKRFNIVRFEERPKYIGIEVEKDDSVSHVDVEEFIRMEFGQSIINCFSDKLVVIPGFGVLPGGEALSYINSSFPILNFSSNEGNTHIFHICFGI